MGNQRGPPREDVLLKLRRTTVSNKTLFQPVFEAIQYAELKTRSLVKRKQPPFQDIYMFDNHISTFYNLSSP